MKKAFFTILTLLLCQNLFAQNEGNIWYFGYNAGVSFNQGVVRTVDGILEGDEAIVPAALTDGAVKTLEGVATISDPQGELLFYTDGNSVWNKNHVRMPNGKGLMGDSSSTQSAVVVPSPSSPKIYYIFTIDKQADEGGFRYSVVDMSMYAGLGDVKTKNEFLLSPVTEKITAVKHQNGKDIWVITHEWESNAFYTYLVTSSGVQKKPVISRIGSKHTGDLINTQGCLKASPSGKRLAAAVENDHFFEVFDFDNSTGKITNPIKVQLQSNTYPYGVEFSPDETKMYVTTPGTGHIYQFNLGLGTPNAVINSGTIVGSNGGIWLGALQLGPDDKIYVARYDAPYLGVIHRPDRLGEECIYDKYGVTLANRRCKLGLPTFIQSNFIPTGEPNWEGKPVAEADDTPVEKPRRTEPVKPPVEEKPTPVKEKPVEVVNSNVVDNTDRDFSLDPIYFDTGKSFIGTNYKRQLMGVVNFMKRHPEIDLEVTGHTDSVGGEGDNKGLSQRRAEAVASFLISQGVQRSRIRYQWKGETQPLYSNTSNVGRAYNRRAELSLVVRF